MTDPVADPVNNETTSTSPFEGLGVPRAPTEPDPDPVVDDPGPEEPDPDQVNDAPTSTSPFEGLGVPRAPVDPDPDPVVDDPDPEEPDPDPVVDDPDPEDPLPPGDDPVPGVDPALGDEPGATTTDAVPGLNKVAQDTFANWDDLTGDTFVFDVDWGNSTITEFIDGERIDPVIAFSSSLFADFADLQTHMQQVGDDVVISDGDNNTLTIRDTELSQLGADDFSFF